MRSNRIYTVSRMREVSRRDKGEIAGERQPNIFRGGAAGEAQLNDGKATRDNEDAGDEARRGSESKTDPRQSRRMTGKTQSVIAPSSGASELYATVKASAEGLGVMATDRDLREAYYGKV